MTDRTAQETARLAKQGVMSSLRTCVATRREAPPEELIRFVADPQGRIVPDLARKLPGRGVWVSCNRAAVFAAADRNLFAKSLKRKVIPDPALADSVERLLIKRLVGALSIANKAGLVIAGFAQVDAAIASGRMLALIHAVEAAPEGCAKLDRRFRAICRDLHAEPVIHRNIESAQLGLAIGRSNVIHAALEHGGAAWAVLREAGRLARFGAEAIDQEVAKPGSGAPASSSLG
jgi:predicted RNA-binding protein YlxR (DUF448 family)